VESVKRGRSRKKANRLASFGEQLRLTRRAISLSLSEVAELVGVTKGYLSRLEAGKATVRPSMVDRIAAVLKTDAAPLHVLAGYLPDDIKQILSEHPVEAPDLLRANFARDGVNPEASTSDSAEFSPALSGVVVPVAHVRSSEKLFETILGDCFEWMASRKANSIHAVVTDPPYGLKEYTEPEKAKLRSGHGGVWRIPPSFDGCTRRPLPRFTVLTEEDKEALQSFFARWAKLVYDVLVPGGHVFIATNALVSQLVYVPMIQAGFEKRGEIIRLVQTLRGGDRPKNAHREFAAVTVMPRSAWEPWGLFRKPCEGRVQDNLRKWRTGGLRRISPEQPFADVIRSAPTRNGERDIAPHPSLKPQAFMRQIVRAALPLGEGVVLDPFMGAGSTIAAASALGYRSIGIELDPEFYDMALSAIPRLAALAVNGEGRTFRADTRSRPQAALFGNQGFGAR
jgi:site-specific DNA-methyltransferase (adenine-specific)